MSNKKDEKGKRFTGGQGKAVGPTSKADMSSHKIITRATSRQSQLCAPTGQTLSCSLISTSPREVLTPTNK